MIRVLIGANVLVAGLAMASSPARGPEPSAAPRPNAHADSELDDVIRAMQWVDRLMTGEEMVVVTLYSDVGSVLSSVAPTPINCGDGVPQATDHTSHPPMCGDTPQEAQANAALALLGTMTEGFECAECPTAGACELQVSTLPGGWELKPYFQEGSNGPYPHICDNQWACIARYSGPYIVYCSPCPME